MVKLFEGAIKNWKFVVTFVTLAVIFWLLEFSYQFYVLIPGELYGSLLRSFALAGASFIGTALFLSSIFRWFPEHA